MNILSKKNIKVSVIGWVIYVIISVAIAIVFKQHNLIINNNNEQSFVGGIFAILGILPLFLSFGYILHNAHSDNDLEKRKYLYAIFIMFLTSSSGLIISFYYYLRESNIFDSILIALFITTISGLLCIWKIKSTIRNRKSR